MRLLRLLNTEVFTRFCDDLIPTVVHCLLGDFLAGRSLFLPADIFKELPLAEVCIQQILLGRRERFDKGENLLGAILKKWTAKSERWYNNKKRRETHGKHQVYRGIQAKHSKLV